MIQIIIGHAIDKDKGSDGITHEPEPGGWMKTGYQVLEHEDFPATSLADTLYGTGKTPTFEERRHPQRIAYLESDEGDHNDSEIDK